MCEFNAVQKLNEVRLLASEEVFGSFKDLGSVYTPRKVSEVFH